MIRSSNRSSHLLPPYYLRPYPATLLSRQHFHTTCTFRADDSNKDHYETLNLPLHASQAEIKGQFYHLSKTHHPDHNRNDPDASARFVKISEAYAVLGTPQKRELYDRDLRRSSQTSLSSAWSSARGGSHGAAHRATTTGPAGGRPASGLSRRRGQFKGPPPSFYRSGGWGVHARKRQAAAADAAASAAAAAAAAASSRGGGTAGEGPSASSSSSSSSSDIFGDDNDVPHFDRRGHFRTQQRHDAQRLRRLAQELGQVEPGHSILRNFVFVGGILVVSLAVPSFLYGVFLGGPGLGRPP